MGLKNHQKIIKKTVFITGAGRGLGKATANAFLEAGFFVIATDIDPGLLTDFSGRDNVLTLPLDVTSESETEHCAKGIEERFENLDIVISNAGIFDFYPVSEAGSEKIRKIFDVNVFALANLTKYFLPLLEKSKGRIIVISSESYKVPSPFQPYAVSKQALESVYNAIKLELTVTNVKCVLIRPGAIRTKILSDTIGFSTENGVGLFQQEFKNFVKSVPKYIGKISDPSTVAQLIRKAALAKHPKAVYSINHNPLVSLLSHLPKKLKNDVIRKSLKKM